MILHGDCLAQLKNFPDNYFHAVVTDPPYGLAFMGKKWDYDVPSVDIWKEVLRVLRPGGHVLSFGGTRTYHRMVVAIEDAGFEIRDQLQWIYGSGFPKSLDVSKAIDKAADAEREVVGQKKNNKGDSGNQTYAALGAFNQTKFSDVTAPATDDAKIWEGWGTALKPAHEPICMARKPLEKGLTVAQNVLKWGAGAINVDASRIGVAENDPNKRRSTGGYNSGDSLATVPNAPYNSTRDATLTQGRWPANVMFDEAAAEVLDAQSGNAKAKPGRTGKRGGKGFGMFDDSKSAEASGEWPADPGGGASRFFYVAKASKSERNAGLEGMPEKRTKAYEGGDIASAKTPDSPGGSRTAQNFHPTVKPVRLMEYLIRMVTPPTGIVLDPFAGSGTTGVAAVKNGFGFIGIEREAEYVKIAEKRIEAVG